MQMPQYGEQKEIYNVKSVHVGIKKLARWYLKTQMWSDVESTNRECCGGQEGFRMHP